MNSVIDPVTTLNLGVASMDRTHTEFIDLVNRLCRADKTHFVDLFIDLLEHTENHFAAENASMQASGFPAIHEHMEEHWRVLGEMSRIANRVAGGSLLLGRAYVRDSLPEWFRLHLLTMDSALAAHMQRRGSRTEWQRTTG